jgi:hypothetical protein
MLAPNLKRHRGSVNYQRKQKNINFSQMIPNSMDPRAFQRFDQMGGAYPQNNFNPGYMPEEQFRGIVNRFSLSRVNNK